MEKSKKYTTLVPGSDIAKKFENLELAAEAQSSEKSSSSTAKPEKKPSKSGMPPISYSAEEVIGSGSFGVVYRASVQETGEIVAIKKVLQDARFKNREMAIMKVLNHPCVIMLRHCFYSKKEPDELYLNLVMDFIPSTIHQALREHKKAHKNIPLISMKIYMWQICRSLGYIHSEGICHRDIKPQNLLLNTKTHDCKLCDFGSAKVLVKGEPNVAYICSRYYRAPELVFEATEYTCTIDVWSIGCVMAEFFLNRPLFAGESGVSQLAELIGVLGSPTKADVKAMNPNPTEIKFPEVPVTPWATVFKKTNATPDAIDLLSKILRYKPTSRVHPLEALAHPMFDELRQPGFVTVAGEAPVNLFNVTPYEINYWKSKDLVDKVLPVAVVAKLKEAGQL